MRAFFNSDSTDLASLSLSSTLLNPDLFTPIIRDGAVISGDSDDNKSSVWRNMKPEAIARHKKTDHLMLIIHSQCKAAFRVSKLKRRPKLNLQLHSNTSPTKTVTVLAESDSDGWDAQESLQAIIAHQGNMITGEHCLKYVVQKYVHRRYVK